MLVYKRDTSIVTLFAKPFVTLFVTPTLSQPTGAVEVAVSEQLRQVVTRVMTGMTFCDMTPLPL